MKLQYHLRVNNHIFKQTTMAIIIVVIFGKTVNFQHFATLEPGLRFHFSKVAVGIKQYSQILCNTLQPWIAINTKSMQYYWQSLNNIKF